MRWPAHTRRIPELRKKEPDCPVPAVPDVDPAEHATERHVWPGLAAFYVVHVDGRHYAWTEYADHPGSEVTEVPTAEAARQHLTVTRARLLLTLQPAAVIARAEAHCLDQPDPLFAAVVAKPGGDSPTWLATWDATPPGTHALTSWGDEAAAVEAFAAATEEAAARIEQMQITWPEIIAAHLRYRVQVARAAAARAALGDALRRHEADIRAKSAITGAARMADVGNVYLYRVLKRDAWTWDGAMLAGADLRSAERRRSETRLPGAAVTGTDWPAHATFAVTAGNLAQARTIIATVLDALHLAPASPVRAEPLRAGSWTVHADIEIPGMSAIDPGDAHSRAVHLAGLIRGAGNWTLREGPGHFEAEWPPDIWAADPGDQQILITPAVKAAVIRAIAPAAAPRPRSRHPARRTDVRGRAAQALGAPGGLSLTSATAEFEAMFDAISGRFVRPEVRRNARAYLLKLSALSDRLHGWDLPARTGQPGIEAARRLLTPDSAIWSADELRDDLRSYVTTRLGNPTSTLVVAETAFHKQGSRSAGVQRQYSPVSGKQENCQIGVFLGYGGGGHLALIDRELFLPDAWTRDPSRFQGRAGLPEDVAYRPKPELARAMIERASAAGVPYRWVTADRACGDDPTLRAWLTASGASFVLPVHADFTVDTGTSGSLPAGMLAEAQNPTEWRLLPDHAATAPTAARDWTVIATARPGRYLLARRIPGASDLALFDCQAPAGTTLAELAAVADAGSAISACLQSARNEAGLDDYLALRYDSWYRHITLSLLAAAFLSVLGNTPPAPPRRPGKLRPASQKPVSVGEEYHAVLRAAVATAMPPVPRSGPV